MKRKSVNKGLENYDKIIEEHREKILKEKKKSNPNIGAIDYWEKEIKKFIDNRNRLAEKL